MSCERILHHYNFSNFSEKVRLMFGLKGLDWHSVHIPAALPKPDYTPLTGGYRRTPALQIGADIYCDTRLIAEILEAYHPEPTLFPGPDPDRTRALSYGLATWAESQFLWPLALYITGIHADQFSVSFHADRARLHGKVAPNLSQVKKAAERSLPQVRSQLMWFDDLLKGKDNFVLGDSVSLADLTLYHPLFLLEIVGGRSEILDEFALIRPWMERVAALGHGHERSLRAESAIEIASSSTPKRIDVCEISEAEEAFLGDVVLINSVDDCSSPSVGVLVFLGDHQISLRLSGQRLGTSHVHFPRVGYRIRKRDTTK